VLGTLEVDRTHGHKNKFAINIFMQLYSADCLKVLPQLPRHSIDTVIVDPPYGINFQSNHPKQKRPKILNDKTPFLSFIPFMKPLLKDTGCVMVFTKWTVQDKFVSTMNENGLKVKNVIIWDKVSHGMGDLNQTFSPRYESILFSPMNGFRFQRKRPDDIIRFKRVSNQRLKHPNEKPVEMLDYLISNTTPKGGVVLDCFMGSGSSGVAALNLGMDYIGIELDPMHFKTAFDRIMGKTNCYPLCTSLTENPVIEAPL